jgi:FkbM family methyltransferase
LPPLRFRSGFTVFYGPHDDPVSLLHEIFGERHYTRNVKLPTEGVMIDLGANIGVVTLDWASRGPQLRIHAYEPNPSTNQILTHNIDANELGERVTVHPEAVAGAPGEMRLWTNVHSMIATGYSDTAPRSGAIAEVVPVIDLNEVVRRAGGSIALLKMDTEGAEAETLEGATPVTLRAIEQVVLEYHESLCPNALARCKKVLEEADFHCRIRPINATQGLIYASRNEAR